MTALALFASTYLLVLALGMQSLNVNRGHYIGAMITSLIISAGQLYLLKFVPGSNTSPVELIAYFLGGPLGIVTSMWLHPKLARPRRRNKPSHPPRSQS